MQDRNHSGNSHCRPGVPPKLGEKPAPLPFLSPKPPSRQPSTRVHTAETTINGKTYETITVETPYGSTTTTKEKKPKTAKQLEREKKITGIILIVEAIVIAVLLVLAFLRKRGLV